MESIANQIDNGCTGQRRTPPGWQSNTNGWDAPNCVEVVAQEITHSYDIGHSRRDDLDFNGVNPDPLPGCPTTINQDPNCSRIIPTSGAVGFNTRHRTTWANPIS